MFSQEASDTTVSPSDDQIIRMNITESTPNTTPLPNGSTHYLDMMPLSLSQDEEDEARRLNNHLQRIDTSNDNESDEDDEEGTPPPLPQQPPPSSSSASSATPPDLLDEDTPPIDSILPRTSSQLSIESEDLHSDTMSGIIEPPEGFSIDKTSPSSPTRSLHLSHKSSFNSNQQYNLDYSPKSGVSAVAREGFRRVRSNPSLATNKIMSVISSGGNELGQNMKRTISQDVPYDKEYVMKLHLDDTS